MDVAFQTPKKRQHGSCFIKMVYAVYAVCVCSFCSWILALKPHDFSSNVACNGTSPAIWGTAGSDSLACSKLEGTRAASQDGKKWLVIEAWNFPVGGNLWFFGRVYYSPSILKIPVWRVDIALSNGEVVGCWSCWWSATFMRMYYVLWFFPESIMILWVMLRNGSVAWVLYGIWTAIAENIV